MTNRVIITRWRLSCHRLRVETGRYTHPRLPREQRVCSLCGILEDEQHVIFVCPIYNNIRLDYEELLSTNNTITMLLNPNRELVITTAKLLYDIENLSKDMKLQK